MSITQSSRFQSALLFLFGLFFLTSASVHAAVTNVSTGQTYSLAVTADGTAPFTYQWYHDGAVVTGATSSVYSGTAKASDAGIYYVTVSNSAGSTNSGSVSLAVISVPAFTTQPSSQTVTVGGAVTFTATASGSPAPTYQWRKNSVNISGATGASYAIASVVAADAGTYSVVATNSAGTATSGNAVLTIGTATPVAPAITTQPVSQTVTTGSSVTFTAAASGSPAPTYQWRKDGVNISGATSAAYAISTVTSANAGVYTVIATNSAGSATSAGATLTVNAAAATVTIWSASTVPVLADAGADKLVELGVKFKSDVAGTITGVRFYKSAANTGTHVGNLWSSTGTLLATAIFSGETTSGWQQVSFPSPVTIAANTVYVVSYFCPVGHYSADTNYFSTKGTDNAPLHALANGVSGSNGVYAYGSSSIFPNQTWNASNYWVDVVFKPTVAVTLTSIKATPANAAVAVGATQQFVATGTYSDATTKDLSSQVIWSSSNTAVATVNTSTGLATTATVPGTSTISATLSGVTGSTTLTAQAAVLAISTASLPNGIAGSSYSGAFAATGGTAPYTWVVASGALPAGVVLNASTGALTGTPTSAGTASLTVRVTDAGSPVQTITKALTITINSAPTITTQPASQTVTAGANVTFTVVANGTPAPTYQWQLDGTVISGATTGTLSIANAQAANAGGYTVVATNSAGSVTSNAASLTVNPLTIAPVFTTQPVSQTLTAGANVTFTVAASGTPTPTYQWKLDGTVISGATTATLNITNAQAANAGGYTVVATNSAGSVTSNAASLTVNPLTVAPVITTPPVSQTVTAGANVTFTAAANGTPAPVYQWQKNGVAISGATSASYTVPSVTVTSAGTYTVVASNVAGSVSSSGAVLTVNAVSSAPVFTAQPASQAVKKGLSVTFVALASGSPSPTYQWRKNGTTIKGATSASYTIAALTTGNAGTYTVVATNTNGSATSTGAVLTVTTTDAPLAMVDFNADNKSDIVWQNITTGEFQVSFMNGTAPDEVVSLGSFSSQWKIGGVADFNSDGSPDILCQDTVTGEWSIWLMSGVEVASKVSLGYQSLNSRICAIGDFNGDHLPDIVVQDSATNQVSIWMMSGAQPSSVVPLTTLAANWQICGSGDFGGDGKSDLVLQNTLTGQVTFWYMAGTTVTWKTTLTTVSPEWQVCGAGDYNGDGKSDVLCQNVLTGECSLWLISSNAIKSKVSLGTQSVDWVIRN